MHVMLCSPQATVIYCHEKTLTKTNKWIIAQIGKHNSRMTNHVGSCDMQLHGFLCLYKEIN